MSDVLPRILTKEELQDISVRKALKPLGVTWEVVDEIINSHRELFKANAELSFKNMKLKEVLDKLDAHIDFSFPPAPGELMEFKDVSGISQAFKEAYRIINPEQASINEALEETK